MEDLELARCGGREIAASVTALEEVVGGEAVLVGGVWFVGAGQH